MKCTALIVDDEWHARRYLREMLSRDDDVVVLGECKNGQEVLKFLKNQVPDLLFMDIRMPGLDGLQVAQQVRKKSCQVIFTTAYNHYALQAFETEALDYLLKPFSENRLSQVLHRAKMTVLGHRKLEVSERLEGLINRLSQPAEEELRIFKIKERGIEQAIRIQDVICIQASSVYVELVTQRRTFLYRSALSLLDKQLPSSLFKRIHRSVVINRNHIIGHKYLNNNRFEFKMSNDMLLTSSKAYKSTIGSWIG